MKNRNRDETLSSLGRSPSRTGRVSLAPQPAAPEPPADRGAVRRWVHSALFDNVGLKFLSVVLAITVFLLVNTDTDQETAAKVGVGYTLPDDKDKVLISGRVDELRIMVKGPKRRLQHFDDTKIARVDVDLRRGESGDVLITSDMIHLPAGLTVTSITPRTLHLTFDKRIEKVVVIDAKTDGQPQHGFFLVSAKPNPATIQVRGAETALSTLAAVSTAMISIESRTESFVAETTVVPPDGVDVIGSPRVSVPVAIDEMLVKTPLVGLPIAIRGDGADKWSVTPAQVNVTLTGSLLAVEKAKDAIAPYVKLVANADGKSLEVVIEGLPPGIGATISPERVKVAPQRAAPPAP